MKFNHSIEFVIANTSFYYTGLQVFTVVIVRVTISGGFSHRVVKIYSLVSEADKKCTVLHIV